MSASLNQLIGEMRPWARALVDVAARAGLQPRVTSTRRSHAEQSRLYRHFLQGGNPYPVAPPGTSAHEFGYAFDLAITPMSDRNLQDLGTVWTGWGGVWGGEFEDPIHFEFPGFAHKAKVKESIRCGGVLGLAGLNCGGLYHAEDVTISLLTPFKATLLEWLLEAGYPQSTAVKILTQPVSTLHRKYPWLPI